MIRARVCVGVMAAAIAACGCSSGGDAARPADTIPSSTTIPVQHVVVSGRATFDGSPFDAQFLGAVVRTHGLVTPCQKTLPPVGKGRYEIEVLSSASASGCGAPGTDILLWTFVHNKQYFSTKAVPWPADGHPPTFDATFTTTAPNGAAPPRTEFAGEIFDSSGQRLPDGTRGRGVCRQHALRRRLGADEWRLHRIQPQRCGARLGRRMRARREGDVPRRRTYRQDHLGQQLPYRSVAQPDPALTIGSGPSPAPNLRE